MQVRIRHENEIRGRLFCEIEPTQEAVDKLVAMLRYGGGVHYYDDAGGTGTTQIRNIEYSFHLDEDGAYCELLLSPDEE